MKTISQLPTFVNALIFLAIVLLISFAIFYVRRWRNSKIYKIKKAINLLERNTRAGAVYGQQAKYNAGDVVYIRLDNLETISIDLKTNEVKFRVYKSFPVAEVKNWKEYQAHLRKYPLLVEDECAPDALQYFKKQFKELIGHDLSDWKKFATRKDYGDNIRYYFDDLELIDEPEGHSLIKLVPCLKN